MGNLLNKAIVKTVKFLDEAPSNPKKLIKGSPGLDDNPKILLKGKGNPGANPKKLIKGSPGLDDNPKILLKGKSNLPNNPKIVIKDGKGSAAAKSAKKRMIDPDVEISDLLTKVRDGIVGDKFKRADTRALKKNFTSLTPDEQKKVEKALATIKPGQTINDLIAFGKEKKKALLVAAAVSPGVASAGTQAEDESQVLTQFEKFQQSPEGQIIISEVNTEFEQRKAEFKPEESAKGGAFVMDRIRQGDNVKDIKDFLTSKNLGAMDIGPSLIVAGKTIRDLGLTGGVDEERIRETLSARGYSNMQISAVFEEGVGKGIQGEVPLLPPIFDGADGGGDLIPRGDSRIQEAKTAASMTMATPEEERQQLQQAVLDSFIDPKEFNIAELEAMNSQLNSRFSTILDTIKGFAGDRTATNRAKLANIEVDNQLSAAFNKFGVESKVEINPNTNTSDILVRNAKGVMVKLSIPIYDQIVEGVIANRVNIAMSGVAFAVGGIAAIKSVPLSTWQLKPLVGFVGGSIAAGGAAAFGTGVDAVRNAVSLRQQLNMTIIKEQMKEALIFESVLGLAGTVVIKGSGIILKSANDFLIHGNRKAAVDAMLQIAGMTRDMAEDKIAQMQNVLDLRIGNNESMDSVMLRVLPRTEPRLTGAVEIATKHKPISSVNVAEEVNQRAKNVIKATSNATDDNIGQIVSEELTKYTEKVVSDYAAVKNIAIQEIDSMGTYTFDYNKLAIEPVLQRMEKITGGFEAAKLESIVNNIRDLGAFDIKSSITKFIGSIERKGDKRSTVATVTTPVNIEGNSRRTFADLLELRVAVNQLTSSKTLKSFADRSGARSVIQTIDNEITRVMKDTPDGEDWLKLWDATNKQYGKYKEVKENILFKALTAKGQTNQEKVNTLSKHIGDIDDTFMEVVEKLPSSVKGNVEDSIINKFVGDFTVGKSADIQAIHYPMLAEKLKPLKFTTTKARTVAKVITDMATVLRADPNVGVATDQISIEAFKSAFTADPIVRAKMALASKTTNYVRRYLPGESGKASALVTKIAKTFNEPLNIKSIDEMVKDMPKDLTIIDDLKQLRISMQQFGKPLENIKIVTDAVDSKAFEASKGSLGKGVYFKSNKEFFSGTSKNRLTNMLVRPERVAKVSDIENLIGVDKYTDGLLLKDPTIKRKLEELGFIGVSVGDDVMLFQ